jgi:conjugative relaxase-like TrwC/TraI family protein
VLAHLTVCQRTAAGGGPGSRTGRVEMLTIAKLKRWSINYYNDTARAAGQAARDARKANGGLGEYYSESETRAPVWVVVGDTAKAANLVGLSDAERAGAEADPDVAARWLDDGVAPNGASGRAFGTGSVHGFDLTFCAPKSVSVLRGVTGGDVVNKAVAQAHSTALREALEYLAQHAGYTRIHNPATGEKDLARLPGLVTVAYQHETSRAGDPHLHTHVIVPNRQARADGTLVSLDGTSLYHEARAAGVIYQATLRRELHQLLGIEWQPVDPHTGMAEIAGIDPDTIRKWSQRSTQLREWAAHNLVLDDPDVGPTATQLATAQKATRPAKPEHLAWAELRRMWAGDKRGFTIHDAAQSAARHDRVTDRANALHAAREAAAGIDTAAFTRADLVEAIGARIPVVDDAPPGTVRAQIEALADRVALRITSARLPHEREGRERYTSAPIITEEAAVLALMPARDERAAIPESAVKTAGLSTDQARAITAIATSPWLIQPLSAPAGAGKTTSLKALRAAAHRAGRHRVLVLAPTGKAVDVAVREGAGDAGYTVAKALRDVRSGALTLDAGSLVIADEAGMVGTPDLHELLTATTRAGAKTVLVGDARQLAPVNARGGMFNQLCDDLPWAQRLTEVWRMRDPAERSASLALRDGGPAGLRHAIGWYHQHRRVHTGDPVTMSADALTAWRADRHAGKDSILVADTWEVCDALNTRIHGENTPPCAPTATAARGHRIAATDIIISRHNDPTIEVFDATDIRKSADPVRNGNRWRVTAVDPKNNRVAARRIGDNARAVFSGDYLRQHIHHGYAVTVHAAQGVTADTTHAVLSDRANRATAYVALSRGRDANTAYLWERIAGEADHEHAEHTAGVHVARRGTGHDAAALLRTIAGRDQRAQTVMAAAAEASPARLPQPVRELLREHNRTRATCRADYRAYIVDRATRSGYDIEAELPTLRAEVELLQAAGARSPAAMYRVPEHALARVDEHSRSAVTAIANSAQAIQSVQLHTGANKPALLAALAAAAHDHQLRILALPATDEATRYAQANCYANATRSPTAACANVEAGRWKLPIGSLVIVDDADHLPPHQMRQLIDNADPTNTKLLLITNDDGEPAHTLSAALNTYLPWAQQLGTPGPRRPHHGSAIERAEQHRADQYHHEVARLLKRRDDLVRNYNELAEPITRTASTEQQRSRTRGRGAEL